MTPEEARLRAKLLASETVRNLLLKDNLDGGLASLHYSPTDIAAINVAIQDIAKEVDACHSY